MRILCLILPLLWLAGCRQEPARTLLLDAAEPLKLGQITVSGSPASSPYVVAEVPRGQHFIVHVANPGKTPISLRLEGAQPESVSLAPYAWTRLRGRLSADTLSFHWQGGELRFSSIYLEAPKKQPNVLLVSVDTLRADFFNAEHMPATFALMSQGTVFDATYTTAPWTLPAHVSMLTSQYPARHGVRQDNQRIPEKAVTLAEVFRDNGYYTVALTEGNYVSATYGLDQGFHEYRENPPSILDKNLETISKLEANLATLTTQLEALDGVPRFAFFHTYEVHCPYVPRGGLKDDQGLGLTQWLLDADGKPLASDDLAQLKALYGGEVSWLDQRLAVFLEKLLARGDWIVVLTSDHGEEFGEHGGLLHADTVYQETTHIPFAIVGPGVPNGQDRRIASLVDVPATLLGRFGFNSPDSWQGKDLLDPEQETVIAFAESFYFGPQIHAVDPRVVGVWRATDKLIQMRNSGKISAELYNLETDPGETNNLQATQKVRRDALFLFLESYLSGKPLDRHLIEGLSEEQIETMRSLGYIK